MNYEIEKAIESLARRAREATSAAEAMQFAQAALNLAHVANIEASLRAAT